MRSAASAVAVSITAAVLGGGGCGPSSGTNGGALMCTVQAPTVCPDPPPHWPDVSPIFQSRCVECHNTMVAGSQWPLMQYQHAADWHDVIRTMLLDCSMPPPDAGVPMTDDERVAILTWLLCGYLE